MPSGTAQEPNGGANAIVARLDHTRQLWKTTRLRVSGSLFVFGFISIVGSALLLRDPPPYIWQSQRGTRTLLTNWSSYLAIQ